VDSLESLRDITIPGAAGVIAHSSGDGLLGSVETTSDLGRLALTQRSSWTRFVSGAARWVAGREQNEPKGNSLRPTGSEGQ
jgi:hypothetical protein